MFNSFSDSILLTFSARWFLTSASLSVVTLDLSCILFCRRFLYIHIFFGLCANGQTRHNKNIAPFSPIMSDFSFSGPPSGHPSRSAATTVNFNPEASSFPANSFSFPGYATPVREVLPEQPRPVHAYPAHVRTTPSTSRIGNHVPPSPHAHASRAHSPPSHASSRHFRSPASSPPPTSAILNSNGLPPNFADAVANAFGYSDEDMDMRRQLHGFVEVLADFS